MVTKSDISLLFGVAGGGSINGESGRLISGQLSVIVAEINKKPFEVGFKVSEASVKTIKTQIELITKDISELTQIASGNQGITNLANAISGLADGKSAGIKQITDSLVRLEDVLNRINNKNFNITNTISPARSDIANIDLYRNKASEMLKVVDQLQAVLASGALQSGVKGQGDLLKNYLGAISKYDYNDLLAKIGGAEKTSELRNVLKVLQPIYDLSMQIVTLARSSNATIPAIDTSGLDAANEALKVTKENAEKTREELIESVKAAEKVAKAPAKIEPLEVTEESTQSVTKLSDAFKDASQNISSVLDEIRAKIESTFDLATIDLHTDAITSQINQISSKLTDTRGSIVPPSTPPGGGGSSIDDEAQHIKDATNAIKKYYEVLLKLRSTKNDVTYKDNEFFSPSGISEYDGLAAALNRTKTAFDLFTSAGNMSTLSAEGQAKVIRVLIDTQQNYAIQLDKINTTERFKEEAAQTKDLNTAVNEYIKLIREAAKIKTISAPEDLVNGEWTSSDVNAQTMIDLLNERRNAVVGCIEASKDDSQVTEAQKKILEQWNKEVERAARVEAERAERLEKTGRTQQSVLYTLRSGASAITRYSRAESSANAESREAYDNWKKEYEALEDANKAYQNGSIDVEQLRNAQDKYNRVAAESERVLISNGENVRSFSERIKNLASRFGSWLSVSQIIMAAVRNIKKMIQVSIELESAFASLKIITGATESEMSRFASTAANLAKSLGQSITDVTKSIETFSRLGYSLEDASKLAEYATMMANVAGVSNEEATTGLTSIIKGFNLDVDQAEHIADILVSVGQKYAVSASEMMSAYEKSGAALNATNTSLEKSAGLIAAANASVQNANITGTALKTVSARIRGSKADLEELGESIDDLADGFSKYANEIQALTGFSILKEGTTNQFKDLYEIFDGLAAKWDELSDTQQARVAEILGGTRQLQVIASILGNWGDAVGAYNTAINSAGAATKANDIYMETAAAHIQQFKATFQELSYTVVNSGLIKLFIDFGTNLLSLANNISRLITKLGGLRTILLTVASAIITTQGYLVIMKASMLATAALTKVVTFLKNLKNVLSGVWQSILDTIVAWKAYAAGTVSASTAMQASIPVFGLLLAAITAVWGAFTLLNNKMDESRSAAQEAGKNASSLAKELSTQTIEVLALEEAYSDGKCSISDLIDAQDSLIEKLRSSGVYVDSLTDKFNRNTEAIRDNTVEALKNTKIDLRGAINAYEEDLLKQARRNLKQSGLEELKINLPVTGRWYEKQKVTDKSELEALNIINKYRGLLGIDRDQAGDISRVQTIWDFDNDLSTIDGVLKSCERLKNMLLDLEAAGVSNTSVYQQLYNVYSRFDDLAAGYNDSISSYNSASARQFAIDALKGTENLPKTTEEFQKYRESVFEAIKASGEFIGTDKDVYYALDDYLGSLSQFDEFYKTIASNSKIGNEVAQEAMRRTSDTAVALSDDIANLKTNYDLLSKAQSELDSNGGLSSDTIKELISADESYLDYLYEENGQIKLNTEAYKEQAELQMSSRIAELEASQKELLVEQKLLKARIAQAKEFLRIHSDDRDQKNTYAEQNLARLVAELDEVDDAIENNQSILSLYETIFENIKDSAAGLIDELGVYGAMLDSFSGVADKIKSVSDEFKTLAEMQQLVGKNFRLSQEEALKYAEIYPEILDSATVAANGELQLNETVVNDFIKGKRAELEASVQSKIDELTARKQVMTAIQAFAQEELRIATLVAEGEGKLDFDVNQLRLDNKNALVDALIKAGISEVDAQKMAAEAMAGNYTEVDKVAANASIDIATNLGKAANSAADSIHKNMHRSKQSVASLATQAGRTAHAIRNMMSGAQYAYDDLLVPDSGGGAGYSPITTSVYNGSFNGVSYTYTPQTAALHDFIAQLTQEIADYGAAINQLDGQIALLQALKDHAFDIFSHANANSGGSSGSGSGSGGGSGTSDPSWFETQYKLYQHLLAMDAAEQEDYINWLSWAYQEAFNQGIITLDEFFKYQEEVFNGMRNLFKDYLNDLEHQISMREHFNGETAAILELYQEMLAAVEEEIARAREQGLDDNDSYLQELQEQYWKYHDAIEDLQNSITENAQNAVDDLIQIRIKMLKDEIQREKDAINERLKLLRDFYSKQKEMLRDQYNEEKYLREQSDKRKKIEDILAELAQLEYDNSAWAQRRKLELQQQLAEAQAELDEFEHDHALEMAEDELDHLQEMQEEELNNQLDALEEHENDAQALYQQALEDIKNGSIELYEEMIEWNQLYGDGIEDTIKDAWEAAYQALQDYMDLYGEYYQGIHLGNATGYDPGGTWDDHPIHVPPSGSGQTSSDAPTPPSASEPSSPSTPAMFPYGKASDTTGTIKKGSRGDQVKAIQYALNMLGFGNSGTQSVDGIFGTNTEKAVKAFQRKMEITADGIVGNKTRHKFAVEGYRSGTKYATPGLHPFEEDKLTETVFESKDGSRYKMFTGGEKVLNAKASDFLYKFAMSGGSVLEYLVQSMFGQDRPGITHPIKRVEINMGDIVVQGSADHNTVSEIRRAQRESITRIIKEFNKLSTI